MPAISHRHSFVYFSIPKIATSSMKLVVFELDVHKSFKKRPQGKLGLKVHDLYPSLRPEPWLRCYPAYTSLVLSRDPIKRFLSAYSNRVVFMRSMETDTEVKASLEKEGLSTMPSLEDFIENLERYRKISLYIRNHTFPQSDYVGKIWSRIKHRIPLERIGEVPAIIEEATGRKLIIPHRQTGGEKIPVSVLSGAHFDKLARMYRADYDMLREFYTLEQIR